MKPNQFWWKREKLITGLEPLFQLILLFQKWFSNHLEMKQLMSLKSVELPGWQKSCKILKDLEHAPHSIHKRNKILPDYSSRTILFVCGVHVMMNHHFSSSEFLVTMFRPSMHVLHYGIACVKPLTGLSAFWNCLSAQTTIPGKAFVDLLSIYILLLHTHFTRKQSVAAESN